MLKSLKKNDKIGISAGASTPPAIIKEAINIMSEENFEAMLDSSMVELHNGDIVKGKVIKVDESTVTVNLGYKSDGTISKSEFSDDPNVVLSDVVKEDDEIEVLVLRVNDAEGTLQLSKRRVDANRSLAEIEDAYNNKTVVRGKIVDTVKGGLIALISGARVFVPSSQISNRYVDDLEQFKGKEYDFNIIEFDKNKRKFVAGRKALAQKEYEDNRNKVFSSIKAGDKINGKVSRIVDFGAFVDLGGVDGLIHISELSWGRVKKVSDVLKEGDDVEVTVLDVNTEKGKISLSLKDINSDPWKNAAEKYAVGNVVEGKVVRMVSFGVFVELEEGVDGLVHISQISHEHIDKPEDVLSVGQMIKAKVTDLDTENKKISLSIKATEPKPEPEEKAEESSTEE